MCQHSKNCKNFFKNPVNNSNCMILCSRNPLLNYEINDVFIPLKALTKEEAHLDEQTSDEGGISETSEQAKKAGADFFVSGSYTTKSDNPKQSITNLIKQLK